MFNGFIDDAVRTSFGRQGKALRTQGDAQAVPRVSECPQTMHSSNLGWRMVNPRMPDQRSVSLGETAEIEAERYEISREQQDEFTLLSHLNAIIEWDEGIYDREVVPVAGVALGRDEAIRADTSVEALGTLKPAFRPNGSVTAGNSSPLNDGADAILIGSEKGPIGTGAALVWSPSASAREWGWRSCSNAERVAERGSHARGRMIKG